MWSFDQQSDSTAETPDNDLGVLSEVRTQPVTLHSDYVLSKFGLLDLHSSINLWLHVKRCCSIQNYA